MRYFERVYQQLNRVVDGIDAAADSMAQLMDLRMNETMYWLTVVATIFLPLTFLTGFFGMNFGWMVGKIDTEMAFLTLGIGGSIVAAALIYVAIRRRGTPVEPDQDAVERRCSPTCGPRRCAEQREPPDRPDKALGRTLYRGTKAFAALSH